MIKKSRLKNNKIFPISKIQPNRNKRKSKKKRKVISFY